MRIWFRVLLVRRCQLHFRFCVSHSDPIIGALIITSGFNFRGSTSSTLWWLHVLETGPSNTQRVEFAVLAVTTTGLRIFGKRNVLSYSCVFLCVQVVSVSGPALGQFRIRTSQHPPPPPPPGAPELTSRSETDPGRSETQPRNSPTLIRNYPHADPKLEPRNSGYPFAGRVILCQCTSVPDVDDALHIVLSSIDTLTQTLLVRSLALHAALPCNVPNRDSPRPRDVERRW